MIVPSCCWPCSADLVMLEPVVLARWSRSDGADPAAWFARGLDLVVSTWRPDLAFLTRWFLPGDADPVLLTLWSWTDGCHLFLLTRQCLPGGTGLGVLSGPKLSVLYFSLLLLCWCWHETPDLYKLTFWCWPGGPDQVVSGGTGGYAPYFYSSLLLRSV